MRRPGGSAAAPGTRRWFEGLSALALIVALTTAGCTVGPDYETPVVPEQPEWVKELSEGLQASPVEIVDWWKRFDDPILDRLVEMAQEQNNNLEIAGLNVLAARAQLGIAVGAQWPQVQVAAGDVTYVSPPNQSGGDADFQYNVGATANWELDLWGRFRRGTEAAEAGVAAAVADYEDALILVTGTVVDAYTLIRVSEERLRIAQQNIDRQRRSYDITRVLYEGGEASELDMQQAYSQLLATEASVPAIESVLEVARNGLNIVVGMPPGTVDEFLEGSSEIPAIPEEIAVGVPADLLRRRPDVRAAELQAIAQNARVGVAVADLYPVFSLSGFIGAAAGYPNGTEIGDLFSTDALTFNAGVGLVWPFLNYGRIRNNIRVQDARLQQALINYQETVLRGMQEANDAMSNFVGAKRQDELLAETLTAARRSHELSVLRYQEGFSGFQRVLDAQRALATQQERWVINRGSAVSSLVSLYTALGGGWEIDESDDFIRDETRRQLQERTDWSGYFPEEEAEEEETEER